jgi:catechol 2,3-dioxygenase-like lactoylglutathione lyase family enzyme
VRIQLASVLVDEQEKALEFYTKILGFLKKYDIPMGDFRWLTVVSPEGSDEIELLLEPTHFPPAKTFQAALFQAGIPLTAFFIDDIQKEHERLLGLGVRFKTPPTKMGPITGAIFEDSCGNLIHLVQK